MRQMPVAACREEVAEQGHERTNRPESEFPRYALVFERLHRAAALAQGPEALIELLVRESPKRSFRVLEKVSHYLEDRGRGRPLRLHRLMIENGADPAFDSQFHGSTKSPARSAGSENHAERQQMHVDVSHDEVMSLAE